MKIPSTKSRKIPFGSVKAYHWFNALVFAVVLLLLVSVKLDWIAVRCVYSDIGGCPTCGLTRAFRQIMAGATADVPLVFEVAFVLIAGQLLFRPAVSLLLIWTHRSWTILRVDIVFATLLLLAFVVNLYR